MGKILQGNHSGEELHDEIMAEQAREVQEGKEFIPRVAVVFTDKEEVIHVCAYEEYPSVACMKGLFDELITDEEFGMDKEYVETLTMTMVSIDDGGNIEELVTGDD